MTISGFLPIFLVGCFGGLIGEIGKWYSLRNSPDWHTYVGHPVPYAACTILMIVAGGILAVLYGIDPKNAILVLNIGLSAPLIIKALAAIVPVQPGGEPHPVPGFAGPQPGEKDAQQAETLPVSLMNFLAGR